MEVQIEYNSAKFKLDISQINDWSSLISKIKKLFSIKEEKEIEVYTQPKNAYLMETNFEDEFLNEKKNIKSIRVEEVIDLAEKIKNIGIPLNQIDDADDEEPNKEAKSLIINKEIFKDKCSLCKNSFNSVKYGCLLCHNFFLCSNCEDNHPHPMIKYKNNILSDNVNKIIDMRTSQYIKEKEYIDRIKNKYRIKNIYKIGLRTNLSSNTFIMGCGQTREINILINNNNNFVIPKKYLGVFIKNQYDLKISINDEALHKDIKAKFEIPIKLTIKSNDKNLFETYDLRVEVISNNMDVISPPINLKISINNDKEDDDLNKEFGEFPSIILLPKDKKKKLQYIIKEKLSVKTPAEIKAIMEKFKWSIDDAISDLVV